MAQGVWHGRIFQPCIPIRNAKVPTVLNRQEARGRHHTWSLGVSFLPVHSRGPAVEPVRSQSSGRSLRLCDDDDGVCGGDAPLQRQRNSTR